MKAKWIVFVGIMFMALVLVVGCQGAKSSSSEEKTEGSDDIPEVTIYNNSAALKLKPEGSEPEAFKEVQEYIQEETGVKVNAIVPPQGSKTEKLNVLLASGEEVDIFEGNWDQYKDAVIPLNDLLEEHGQAILEAWGEDAWEMMKDAEGNIMGIPRIIPTAPFPTWVRTDWLENLNMEMPTTIEEFEEVLKAFKEQDPDGNGKDDSIPLLLEKRSHYGLLGGFTEYGYSNWFDSEAGELKIPEMQPGYVDYLKTMADWYQKGYIYKESFADYDFLEMIKTNQLGAVNIWYSNFTIHVPKVMKNVPEMNYEFVKDMKGPKGLVQTIYPGTKGAVMITKTAKNPEAAIKFLNWQYENVENHLVARYGLKDVSWQWIDEENGIFELIQDPNPYAGEALMSLGLATEVHYATNDPLLTIHQNYLKNELSDFSVAKEPVDMNVVYDSNELAEHVPSNADLQRLRTEEVVKFIMGVRPIQEYDDFIEELYNAGLQDLINFQTEQYNLQKK
nr:extracellular solute-binding protein [Fredinandcohnia onubensis]